LLWSSQNTGYSISDISLRRCIDKVILADNGKASRREHHDITPAPLLRYDVCHIVASHGAWDYLTMILGASIISAFWYILWACPAIDTAQSALTGCRLKFRCHYRSVPNHIYIIPPNSVLQWICTSHSTFLTCITATWLWNSFTAPYLFVPRLIIFLDIYYWLINDASHKNIGNRAVDRWQALPW
jgi:hypothetical protein